MSRPPIDLEDSAAVLSAVAEIAVRARPAHTDLMVLLAGDDRRSDTLLLIDDVPNSLPQHERVRALSRMWREVRVDLQDCTTAVVVVCRDGHPDPGGEDLAWHDAARATAAHAGVTCLGVYLATSRGVVQVLPTHPTTSR